MMKKLLLLFISTLISCADNELDSRDYPRMRTTKAEVSTGSVTFSGTYTLKGKTPVTDHGFTWDTTFPDVTHSSKISLGAMDSPGDFQAKVNEGLVPGREYTVRAYAITSEYTVYGENITFTAK